MSSPFLTKQEFRGHLKESMIEVGLLNKDGTPKYAYVERVDENGKVVLEFSLIEKKQDINK